MQNSSGNPSEADWERYTILRKYLDKLIRVLVSGNIKASNYPVKAGAIPYIEDSVLTIVDEEVLGGQGLLRYVMKKQPPKDAENPMDGDQLKKIMGIAKKAVAEYILKDSTRGYREKNGAAGFKLSGQEFYHSDSSGEDNEADEFELAGQAFNDFGKKSIGNHLYHSSSTGEDNEAVEEFELAGQAFNDFEKSEIRFVPLKFRRTKAIKSDYKGLRKYLLKKDPTWLRKTDEAIDTAFLEKSRGKLGAGDELLFSPVGTTNSRKAQAL